MSEIQPLTSGLIAVYFTRADLDWIEEVDAAVHAYLAGLDPNHVVRPAEHTESRCEPGDPESGAGGRDG